MSCNSLIFCNKSLPDWLELADASSAALGSTGAIAGEELAEGAARLEVDTVSSAPEAEPLSVSAMAWAQTIDTQQFN